MHRSETASAMFRSVAAASAVEPPGRHRAATRARRILPREVGERDAEAAERHGQAGRGVARGSVIVAGVVPPTSYALAPPNAVSALPDEAGVPAALPTGTDTFSRTPGAVAAPVMGAVVPIARES